MLTAPRKVARVETESTILEVTTTDTDGVNPLRSKLGVGGLTAELELSLLAVVGALGTGVGAFVPGGAGYTCRTRRSWAVKNAIETIEAAENARNRNCQLWGRMDRILQRQH